MKNIFKTANSKLFLLFLITFLSNLSYGQTTYTYRDAIKADVPNAYFMSNPLYNQNTSRTEGTGISEYREYDQHGNVYYYAVNWNDPNQNFQGETLQYDDYLTILAQQALEESEFSFVDYSGVDWSTDFVSMAELVASIKKEVAYFDAIFPGVNVTGVAPSASAITNFLRAAFSDKTGLTKFALVVDQAGNSLVSDNSVALVKGFYNSSGQYVEYNSNVSQIDQMLGTLSESKFDTLYYKNYLTDVATNNYFLREVEISSWNNFDHAKLIADVDQRILEAQGSSINWGNTIIGGVRGFANYLSEIGGALTGASSISPALNSYYNAAYAPATDPKSVAITYGIIAAPVVAALAMEAGAAALAAEGTEAAANYAYAQVVNSLTQITLKTAARDIALNTLSQWIANGGDVNQINGIEALTSAVPGYVPIILGETFAYSRANYIEDTQPGGQFRIRTPNNYEVAFLQIGGGLVSDKFGDIIDGKAYFRDGVGYTYGEMVKFMVETLSNVIPESAETTD